MGCPWALISPPLGAPATELLWSLQAGAPCQPWNRERADLDWRLKCGCLPRVQHMRDRLAQVGIPLGDPKLCRQVAELQAQNKALLEEVEDLSFGLQQANEELFTLRFEQVKALRLVEESGIDTVEGLNVCLCRNADPEVGANLVHLALLNGLPKVALAIALHPAFELHREVMGHNANITALHLAAALGHLDVCKALLQGGGLALAGPEVERSTILNLSPSGHELILKCGQNALDLAKQENHHEVAAFLKASIKIFLAQDP